MNARIRKTNSGRYYFTIVAETLAEQLELTAMAEQAKLSDGIVHEYGGSAAFNDEVGRSLEREVSFIVREPKVENRPSAKLGLLAKIRNRI
jgi:hypothetical protein